MTKCFFLKSNPLLALALVTFLMELIHLIYVRVVYEPLYAHICEWLSVYVVTADVAYSM